jgi:hypothetical protein
VSWFNRERVATALRAGKISADEGTISELDRWLYILQQVYRLPSRRRRPPPGYKYITTIRCNGPSKELKKLDKALREWINADFESKEMEADVLDSFNLTGAASIEWLSVLSMSISNTITWLESLTTNIRQQQALETAFFIDLYEKYAELSGKRELSDDGPAIRS